MFRIMFRTTLTGAQRVGLGRSERPQVLGTDVPTYGNYTHRASEVLTLYRGFLRMIQNHPPHERGDLLKKVRSEFSSKKFLVGRNRVNKLIERGKGVLQHQWSILEQRNSQSTFNLTNKHRRPFRRQQEIGIRDEEGADRVEAMWEFVKRHTNGVVPNLGTVRNSKQLPVTYRGQSYGSSVHGPTGGR